MAKRPAHTLVFLGAQRTDRVDLGPAPGFEVLAQHHQASHGTEDPALRLEAALGAIPKPGKLVWVLWEGARALILDLPSGVVEGLEQQQLAGALSFEAEPLTSVPAADSAIAGIPQTNAAEVLPEFRRYWISQVAASLRDKMEQTVQRAGAKLAGLAHPGGLPRAHWSASEPDAHREWRRIEIWENVSFSLRGVAGGPVETRVLRSQPGWDAWIAELPSEDPLHWMGPDPGALVGSEGAPREYEFMPLPQEAAPLDWLRAWAEELRRRPQRVPVIEPLSRVSPYQELSVTGGIAAAAAILLCVGHGLWLSTQAAGFRTKAENLESIRTADTTKDNSVKEEARLNAETEKLRPRLTELAQRDAALSLEQDRLDKLVSERATRQTRWRELQAVHHLALAELVAALADFERSDNPAVDVVRDVRQDVNGALRVTGLCREAACADSFATRLEARLLNAGWRVGAAQKAQRDDGVAFDFSVVLTPLVLDTAARPGLEAGHLRRDSDATRNALEGRQ